MTESEAVLHLEDYLDAKRRLAALRPGDPDYGRAFAWWDRAARELAGALRMLGRPLLHDGRLYHADVLGDLYVYPTRRRGRGPESFAACFGRGLAKARGEG